MRLRLLTAPHFKVSEMPLCSELERGGMTEHSSQQLGFDKNAGSISVADPLSTTLVGSCTTCVRSKLEIILCNSVYKDEVESK